MRTVEWDPNLNQLKMIDQRLLPGRFEIVVFDDYRQVAVAIRDMVVRGAPAIGASAAFGMALAACRSKASNLPGSQGRIISGCGGVKSISSNCCQPFLGSQRMMALVEKHRSQLCRKCVIC
jgi:methylthioribose-1-phosphate isomerase